MTAGGAEAVALKLLAVIAKAEGIDLDQVKGGWSRKEILASYRECLTAVRSVFPAPVFTQAPEEPVARVFGADEAWQNVVRRNKFARWALGENPKRVENSAAMRLRAPVFLPGMSPKFRIQNSDVIFCTRAVQILGLWLPQRQRAAPVAAFAQQTALGFYGLGVLAFAGSPGLCAL
jgi:hypothetical protein